MLLGEAAGPQERSSGCEDSWALVSGNVTRAPGSDRRRWLECRAASGCTPEQPASEPQPWASPVGCREPELGAAAPALFLFSVLFLVPRAAARASSIAYRRGETAEPGTQSYGKSLPS